MSATAKAQQLKMRAKALSDKLLDVNTRRAAVDWMAEADQLADDFVYFLERSDVRSALVHADTKGGMRNGL